MTTVTLRLADFVQRNDCPACHASGGRTVASRTLFSAGEDLPGGRITIADEVARARRLVACQRCDLWYYDLIARPGAIEALVDNPLAVERWSAVTDGAHPERAAYRRAHAALGGTSGTIADIGAHIGGFLETLPATWQKVAVEPIAHATAAIDGVRVIAGFIEDAPLPAGEFDCITAFDVFEHLHDADRAVANIARGLRRGGTAIVETGDHDALGARLLRGGWYYLSFLEHVQAFNARSLSSLFERHGIEVVRVERVRHATYGAATRLRAIASVAFFAGLTAAAHFATPWRAFNRLVRPGNPAMPPSTLALEADHIFLVGRKR